MLGDTLTGSTSKYDDDHDYGYHYWPEERENDISTDTGGHVTIEFVEDNAEESTTEFEQTFQPATHMESTQTRVEPSGNKSVSADWRDFTPAKLRQSKSDELRVIKKDNNPNIHAKISSWDLSKSELAEQHTESFWEMHEMKLAHMKEKHEQTMRIEQEEWELKRQHMIELHEHTLKYKK